MFSFLWTGHSDSSILRETGNYVQLKQMMNSRGDSREEQYFCGQHVLDGSANQKVVWVLVFCEPLKEDHKQWVK